MAKFQTIDFGELAKLAEAPKDSLEVMKTHIENVHEENMNFFKLEEKTKIAVLEQELKKHELDCQKQLMAANYHSDKACEAVSTAIKNKTARIYRVADKLQSSSGGETRDTQVKVFSTIFGDAFSAQEAHKIKDKNETMNKNAGEALLAITEDSDLQSAIVPFTNSRLPTESTRYFMYRGLVILFSINKRLVLIV